MAQEELFKSARKFPKAWTFWGLMILTWGVSVWAQDLSERSVLELRVAEPLKVFAAPNDTATQVSQLAPGDVVVVSPRVYGLFRKVLTSRKGQPASGYVRSTDLRRSSIGPRSPRDQAGRRVETISQYRSQKALGLALIPSFLMQGESKFQLQDSSYETTTFESATVNWAISFDWPIAEIWGARVAIGMQQTEFQGRANQLSALPGANSPKVRREQQLFMLSGLVKRYHNLTSPWWYGAGGAIARGQKISLYLDGVGAPTTDEDLPVFASLFAATGYEWPLAGQVFLVPDFRLGTILSTSPMTLSAEAYLTLAWLLK